MVWWSASGVASFTISRRNFGSSGPSPGLSGAGLLFCFALSSASSYSCRHSVSIWIRRWITAAMTGDFMKPGGAIMPPQRFGTITQLVSFAFG